jgi:hypothetical protein
MVWSIDRQQPKENGGDQFPIEQSTSRERFCQNSSRETREVEDNGSTDENYLCLSVLPPPANIGYCVQLRAKYSDPFGS